MLTIVQRSGGMRGKPPEEVRGLSSRLPWAWDGLCFGVPFNDASRGSARDIVGNVAPSVWTSGLSFTKDNRGNVAARMPSAEWVEYPDSPALQRPTTDLTAYARFRRAGTPVMSTGIFAKVHTVDADPWSTWSLQVADSSATRLAANIVISGTAYYLEDFSYTSDTTTWYSAFLRWSSGTGPTLNILGERGQPLATASLSAISGALTYSALPLKINVASQEFAAPSFIGDFSQVMVWSRRLTDTELQALVEDPYGWYSPRRQTVAVSSPYVLPSGGGELRGATGGMGGMY